VRTVRAISPLRQIVRAWRTAGRRIGFVPTMGALHEGHLSLVRRARRENDEVVVSVFVNPTQFGPTEDLTRYPRPFARDAALCRKAGVSALFSPDPPELYSAEYQTWVTVDTLSVPLCGRFRPGHFRGVATVVLKLLNIVQPDRVYFGEKDFQQLRVVQQMVKDLNVPVDVVACPTVREPSGLALSSRNLALSMEERLAAPLVRRALREAGQVLKSRRNVAQAKRAARTVLRKIPGGRIQYVDIVDPVSLGPPSRATGPYLLATAVYVGRTRLIDNLRVG
jgi:pantoate--beta-alanine ligase